jgi:hypothetical protein
MAEQCTSHSQRPLIPVAPALWQALGSTRDAALAAGACSDAAVEAARQLAIALFPALPRPHLREALDALARTPALPGGAGRLRHGAGQPISFRLTPNSDRYWHADWLASRYAGPCIVSAADEDGARGLAARHFGAAEGLAFGGDPWRRRDLVDAEAGGRLPPLPYGMVVPMAGRLGD